MGIYDLTGKTFGHWTVLEPAEPDKYGRAKWYRVSNGAREWEIKNLSKFVRDHVELFGIDPEDKYEAKRTAKMLYDASYNHCRWHGWTVIRLEPNE